jgi:hypothetical protein
MSPSRAANTSAVNQASITVEGGYGERRDAEAIGGANLGAGGNQQVSSFFVSTIDGPNASRWHHRPVIG